MDLAGAVGGSARSLLVFLGEMETCFMQRAFERKANIYKALA